ncbi:hypothetical protein [Streptomyces hydrogenans]|uniref:hypothetical protein n=1 Tax=Streptomyces hydrogenans TaxID=1873719 RepID=UPI0037F12EC1
MSDAGWGELHGPTHLTLSASRRARHARSEVGEGMAGVVMIAANAIGLALTGWITSSELTPAHAAPAPATAPDQPPAEEQPQGPYAPAVADATATRAPTAARTVRGPHERACRCGARASPTP